MKLYSNDNFSHPVVRELRRLGHDALTSLEAGRANKGIPDLEVLAYAASQGRTLLTFNRRHFIRLHRSHPEHAGIIVCTEDGDVLALATRIHNAIGAASDLKERLIRIHRPNVKE